jgi:hypothetical protein
MRKWFYWPASREYSIPWILGPLFFFVLSAFGVFGGSGQEPTLRSPGSYFLLILLLLGLNAMLLFSHIRAQFLTWGFAHRPFFGTFCALTLTYLLLWGAILVARDQADLALNHGFDFVYTLHCIAYGLIGLVPSLSLTALLKSEEPGVTSVRNERKTAQRLLSDLLAGRLQEGDQKVLQSSLEQIQGSANSLLGQLRTREEQNLLEIWKKAAKKAGTQVANQGYRELNDLPSQVKDEVASALNDLNLDAMEAPA